MKEGKKQTEKASAPETRTEQPSYKARLANGLELTGAMQLERERDAARAQAAALAAALRGLLEVTKNYWVLPQVKPSYDAGRKALAAWEAQ